MCSERCQLLQRLKCHAKPLVVPNVTHQIYTTLLVPTLTSTVVEVTL